MKQNKLISTSFYATQFPNTDLKELAFAGRSNCGKSSLINKIFNEKNLAHTSSKPGKTKSINFYNFENKKVIVDLPGYGYAKTSNSKIDFWEKLVSTYINTRLNLHSLLILMDIRRGIQEEEIFFIQELNKTKNFKIILIFTKTDKLSNNELSTKKKEILKILASKNFVIDNIFYISCLKNIGIKELKEHITIL